MPSRRSEECESSRKGRRIDSEACRVAARVRDVCAAAARDAYESAKMRGLCDEGAWEAAVGAIQMVDVDSILDARAEEQSTREDADSS